MRACVRVLLFEFVGVWVSACCAFASVWVFVVCVCGCLCIYFYESLCVTVCVHELLFVCVCVRMCMCRCVSATVFPVCTPVRNIPPPYCLDNRSPEE